MGELQTVVNCDVAVIGAGPAGLAAAEAAKRQGAGGVLVLERESYAGGILNQCIHDGFGVVKFKEALTGPEYAALAIGRAREAGVETRTGVMVTELAAGREITAVSRSGLVVYRAGAVVLATGCRERTRGAISIPGTRPAGIFTAGVAQNLVNLRNILPGRRAVILGSGDIGLIMARRLTLEGAEVLAVVEKLPYPGGLPRNVTQCLEDYGIPLLLGHTVTGIEGRERIRSVTISRVDGCGEPVAGTSRKLCCDTLILSVGLIPENEIALQAGIRLDDVTGGAAVDENLQTSVPGIFACGNALQVHDLVDYVSDEGEQAGRSAARYALGQMDGEGCAVAVAAGPGIRYVSPQFLSGRRDVTLSMRVAQPGRNKRIVVSGDGRAIRTIRCRRLNPAEMQRIPVQSCDLGGLARLEVAVDE
jgi:NADPH-dependent 2,4-dienoyl-CoA reductase/sulfur reductase-like enzyme